MKFNIDPGLQIIVFIFVFGNVQAQKEGPVAHWKFDKMEKVVKVDTLIRKARETYEIDRPCFIENEITNEIDRVYGAYFKLVPGISGNALLLDGNTSFVLASSENAPKLSGDFSIGVWMALGAYPTNWCPLADQNTSKGKGYFLGIDAHGHAGFKIFAGSKWWEIQSVEQIPLRKWTQLEGVYSPSDGMALYLNGSLVSSLKTEGEFEPCFRGDLLIGKYSIRLKPEGTIRQQGTEEVNTFFDGLIDELIIYNRSLSAKEISAYVKQTIPFSAPALETRSLPSWPAKPARFGAVYTTLKYYEAWDTIWRVGNAADVVVQFDENAGKFVFWRGTSYIPNWVSENGIWYNNEFTETWSDKGCHEPMSDKRCQFSNVRILENSDARVVVHWRYALVDNWYNMAKIDTLTGWGDWTDEVYTIYPDGVAVRNITLHSSQPQSPHEWHEGIIVMGPGQRPEQVLNPGALTLANMKGETYTYTWENGIPPEVDKDGFVFLPADANIHLVNTKSELKSFVIIAPEAKPEWDIYKGEIRRDVSMFPWWNHWPTAQKPSDGRYAMDSDLASHSSLSHAHWGAYKQTENSMTKLMLNGLTDKTADKLVPLAKSWSYPAKLKISGSANYINEEYDPAERAYHLTCTAKILTEKLNIELNANTDSPVLNPCFVIKNWGTQEVSLEMDKVKIERGKAFRYGFRNSMEGTDLIVWIKKESIVPINICLIPASE